MTRPRYEQSPPRLRWPTVDGYRFTQAPMKRPPLTGVQVAAYLFLLLLVLSGVGQCWMRG